MKFPADVGVSSQNPVSSNFQPESVKLNLLPSHLSIGVLQEIGRRCNSKVHMFQDLMMVSVFILSEAYHIVLCAG